MSEGSSSKEEVDLAAIEARLANCSGPWDLEKKDEEDVFIAMATQHGRWTIIAEQEGSQGDLALIENAPTDIAALLARARQQDARVAELEEEMYRVKDKAAGVQMANKLLEFDMAGLKEEVERLRAIGLKEFSWSEGGYGGGFECTVVAESLEKAREYIRNFFLNGPETSRHSAGEFMLTNAPWYIFDYTPKLSGYYEYHMDVGG
jgi:hypothetical protein